MAGQPTDSTATPPHEPRWIDAKADDIADGDLVETSGRNLHVSTRTHTPVHAFTFRIVLPNGSALNVYKLSDVRIFDPDGSVAERIARRMGRAKEATQ